MRVIPLNNSTLRSESSLKATDPLADGLPHVCGCRELASFLSVDVKTVQGLAQRHEIPCRMVGKAYRFYRPAVLSWLLGADLHRPKKR